MLPPQVAIEVRDHSDADHVTVEVNVTATETYDAVIAHALDGDVQIARAMIAMPGSGRRAVWRFLAERTLDVFGNPRATA